MQAVVQVQNVELRRVLISCLISGLHRISTLMHEMALNFQRDWLCMLLNTVLAHAAKRGVFEAQFVARSLRLCVGLLERGSLLHTISRWAFLWRREESMPQALLARGPVLRVPRDHAKDEIKCRCVGRWQNFL